MARGKNHSYPVKKGGRGVENSGKERAWKNSGGAKSTGFYKLDGIPWGMVMGGLRVCLREAIPLYIFIPQPTVGMLSSELNNKT